MADTSVPITAGSGTAIDTRTEATNGNHRQVIVVGDPSTNAGVAPVDGTAGLKVDLGADNDVTVTGSLTANAGTNLNTSALALEAGNLAAILAKITADPATQTTLAALLAKIIAAPATEAKQDSLLAKFVTEDAASAANPIGVPLILTRTDTLSTQVSTDDDNVAQRGTQYGEGYVADVAARATLTSILGVVGSATSDISDAEATITATPDSVLNGATIAANLEELLRLNVFYAAEINNRDATQAGDSTPVAVSLPTSTPYPNLDVDESEDEVKATAGKVYFIHAMNLATTKRYLKFYNATAANVTVGTTTPLLTFPIPTLGDTNGQGFTVNVPGGLNFSTAITIAATTGFAVADTGAPGANEVIVNLGYA